MMWGTNSSNSSTASSQPISNRCRPLERVSKNYGVWDDSGTYRVLYVARFAEAVYVLHAFQKKSRATSARDLEQARTRYAELKRGKHA